ncbi:MAG: isopentenyl phosphate kinase [Candidatus Jordarchaeaceae archaeon]
MSVVILKLGGSVITIKDREMQADFKTIKRISREIESALKKNPDLKLVLVHGGGSFGHRIANKYNIHLGLKSRNQIFGFTKTIQVMRKLNFILVEELQSLGLPAIPLQPSAISIQSGGKISEIYIKTVKFALDMGCIPVLWGDAVFDQKQGHSILSGDHIVAFLAQNLDVKRVVFGTDVDGVFDSDPNTNKNAVLIRSITTDNIEKTLQNISGSKTTDVTGGMHRKILEVLPLAQKGIQIEIINAKRDGYILQSLLGKQDLGTLICNRR